MKEGEKDDGTTTASSVANTPFSMESSTSGNKTSGNSQSVNTTRVPERTIQDKGEGVVSLVRFTEITKP